MDTYICIYKHTHTHNRIYKLSVCESSVIKGYEACWDGTQREPYVRGWAWQSCSLLSGGNSGWGDEFITALRVLQEARLAQIPHESKTCDINRKLTSPLGTGYETYIALHCVCASMFLWIYFYTRRGSRISSDKPNLLRNLSKTWTSTRYGRNVFSSVQVYPYTQASQRNIR